MKKIKALLLALTFLLGTTISYAADTPMTFEYFSACAYKEDSAWQSIVLTTVVDEYGVPLEGVRVVGTWDKIEIEECTTDKKGNCRFEKKGLTKDASFFAVDKAVKDDYTLKDGLGSLSIMILRPSR